MDAEIQDLCEQVVESWKRSRTAPELTKYLSSTLDAVVQNRIKQCVETAVEVAVQAAMAPHTARFKAEVDERLKAASDEVARRWLTKNAGKIYSGIMADAEEAQRLIKRATERQLAAESKYKALQEMVEWAVAHESGKTSGRKRNPSRASTAIEELELSVRTTNALKQSGVADVEALVILSVRELTKLPDLGKVGVAEIKRELNRRGWALQQD